MKELNIIKENEEACKDIIDIVNDFYDIDIVVNKTREKDIMIAKHVARYLVRKYCVGMSLEKIASRFGLNEHGTIINSCRVINDAIDVNDIETVDLLNFFTLKVESESESVRSLKIKTKKSKYLTQIVSLLRDYKPDQLKDLVAIIKNYKKAYSKLDVVIQSPSDFVKEEIYI